MRARSGIRVERLVSFSDLVGLGQPHKARPVPRWIEAERYFRRERDRKIAPTLAKLRFLELGSGEGEKPDRAGD